MRHNLLLSAFALTMALAGPARATVLVPGDLGDIARGASVIVRGTVVDVRAAWADGRRRVETVVTMAVAETFKGGVADRVSFEVPGGVIGRYRSVTIGAPTFREGEEVVVCLGARPPELPYVLGLSQGVFRIRPDAVSGQKMVTTPALLSTSASAVSVRRGDPSRQPMRLDEFSTTLRAALTATRTPRDRNPRDIRGSGQH
jgi:hypothetical protein